MSKEFAKTLKELRLKAGYTQKQVYEMLNIPQSTFSSWEIGKSEPSASMTLRLCELYHVDDILSAFGYDGYNEDGSIQLNINEQELIEKYRFILKNHSEGANAIDFMLNHEYLVAENLVKGKDYIKELESRPASMNPSVNTALRVLQYYQRSASAGTGQVVFDDIPVDRIQIPDIPEYKRVSYAIGVNGHSMEPLYEDGDILLVEPTCQIDVGEVGIFIVGSEAFVKKLGQGELISLNKGYKNVPLTEDSKCMGRVVDKLRID